jgi:hypothetical protein
MHTATRKLLDGYVCWDFQTECANLHAGPINIFIMLLEVINNVETTDFYRTGDNIAHYLTFVVIIVFALMFLVAAVKYAKR